MAKNPIPRLWRGTGLPVGDQQAAGVAHRLLRPGTMGSATVPAAEKALALPKTSGSKDATSVMVGVPP